MKAVLLTLKIFFAFLIFGEEPGFGQTLSEPSRRLCIEVTLTRSFEQRTGVLPDSVPDRSQTVLEPGKPCTSIRKEPVEYRSACRLFLN